MALVLEACIQHQNSMKHKDPVHVTAHFLNATAVSTFEVHIKPLKFGKAFTNLSADLIQSVRTSIHGRISVPNVDNVDRVAYA